jgi:hypothetical protein
MKPSKLSAALLTFLLLPAGSLNAQSATGQITGSVRDASGAVIPRVKVTLKNQQTGLTRDTTTNENGSYSIPLLPVGVYSVSAEAAGFSTAQQTDITLNVDQVVRVDLNLAVGSTSETVNVQASAVSIDTETAGVGQVVTTKQVTDLPLNGRNFLQLLFLGAGAVETSGEQGAMRQGVGNAISINGSRPTSNNYLLDGTSNTDTALNTPAVVLSVDAIQEFKEQTATYSAEYGFSANQINIISKTGTNDLHGSLFWFMRNNVFDARSYFQAAIPPLRQNQFGFVAGGPVYLPKLYNGRNKTFWLVNYEGARIRSGFDQFGNVPTPDQLAGRFTSPITDPVTGQPFPNNTIPSSRFSRFGAYAAQRFFPAPNIDLPQGNYRNTGSAPLDTDQQTYRVDQSLGRFGTVFGRYTRSKFNNTSVGFTPLANVFFTQDSDNWQISHSVPVGPHLVNQFRFGYVEATANQSGVPAPQSEVDALKLTGVFENLPDVQRTYPSAALTALSGVGGAVNAYQASNQPMWDISNGTTMIRGNHTFAFGINYRRWQLNRDLANNFLGNFRFTGDFTGNPVADMLLGYYQNAAAFQPAAFSLQGQVGNPRQFNFQYIAPYVQDDWKVSPRLTLNLGVRWDFRTMPYETNDRMGWFNPDAPLGGMLVADKTLIDKGVIVGNDSFYTYAGRRNPQDASKKVFAPRFGFAYRPFGGDRTVIRGGYGVFFDSAEGREIDGSADIYPYVSRGSFDQSFGQPTPLQTTDALFPSFSSPGPVTAAANSFIAVIMSRYPRNPYVQQWSFGVQRQLGSNTTIEVNYLGNKGTHLLMRRNIAQALPYDPANPLSVAARKPYPNFGVYIDSDWSGNSSYNSLNTKFEHRTGSMVLTAVYTWAKSLDTKSAAAAIGNDVAGWQGVLDNHNLRLDRGRSEFDVDHRFVSSFVYNIPVGRGAKYLSNVGRAADAVVGGWQVNGIVTFQRGFPYTVTGRDVGGLLDSQGTNRADLVGQPYPDGFEKGISQWFNTAAFAQPAAGKFGTSGRGILRAPGINNWDMALFKNFAFTEMMRLQARLESFNTWNHTQWNTPVRDVNSKQYGQITGARPGRINQVGLKLIF